MEQWTNEFFFDNLKGVRSDSDMFTYSFSWKNWKSNKIIAPGQEIKDYLTRAAEEEGNKYCAVLSVVYTCCFMFDNCLYQF